jgi:hypothetical protein
MTIAKIIANAPQERLQHSTPIANATTVKNRPSHQSLPAGSPAQFTKIFIPLLRLYCGTLANPWMVPDRFVDELQELWNQVMLDWPHWFDEDDDVYRLVRTFADVDCIATDFGSLIFGPDVVHAKDLRVARTYRKSRYRSCRGSVGFIPEI